MLAPDKGAIIFADFPYEEDRTIKKKRPCLVISRGRGYVLAAKITTTPSYYPWAYFLEAGTCCTLTGEIRKDSYIDLSRREMIPITDVSRIVAELRQEIFVEICELLKEYL